MCHGKSFPVFFWMQCGHCVCFSPEALACCEGSLPTALWVSLLFVPRPWLHLFLSKHESSCKHPLSSLQDLLLSFHQNNDEKVRLQTEEGVINSLMAQRTYSIFAAGKWWVSCLIKYFPFIISVKDPYLIRTIAFQW